MLLQKKGKCHIRASTTLGNDYIEMRLICRCRQVPTVLSGCSPAFAWPVCSSSSSSFRKLRGKLWRKLRTCSNQRERRWSSQEDKEQGGSRASQISKSHLHSFYKTVVHTNYNYTNYVHLYQFEIHPSNSYSIKLIHTVLHHNISLNKKEFK